MIVTQPFYRKHPFWITIILIGFFILFLIFFQNEVCAFVTNKTCGKIKAEAGFRGVVKVWTVFALSLVAFLFLISQFVLPVHTARERFLVFRRLVSYLFRVHGPAIFVHEGKQKARAEEMKSDRPGVAFVDPSSAIVLERQWKPPRRIAKSGPLTRWIERVIIRKHEKIVVPPPLVRAAGPGIVFTRFSERIIGIADLRKQFRINLDVPAYTAEGLEMKAHIFTIFCLGWPPEELKVAYIGEEKPENLRVLQIDRRLKYPLDEKYQGLTVEYIRRIENELDPEDRSPQHDQILVDRGEVHRYAQTKAEMREFLDDIAPLTKEILGQFINDLKPPGRTTILRFIKLLYDDNRAVLYRIFDKLMPIDVPEVGIYRFAFNKTILHQIIDEFENYLTKFDKHGNHLTQDELRTSMLRKNEKRILRSFIDRLFNRYRRKVVEFYKTLNKKTGRNNIEGVVGAFAQKYWMAKKHPRPPRPDKVPPFQSPFVFDPERVFQAIYARGRNLKPGMPTGTDDWTKLPTQIATELYRQELSQINYDDIYLPLEPGNFPLIDTIKPRFARIMRHSGVLSYQLIRRLDGKRIEVGQELNRNVFNLDYPVMKFRQPKPLRERGIRVIHSSFTELKPVAVDRKEESAPSSQPQTSLAQPPGLASPPSTSPTQSPPQPPGPAAIPVVRNQRFDTWQAQWQKQAELIKAETELELMRIRNHARVQTQQEMAAALSQILEDSSNSPDAMAMRVFQALETAATDPSTHQLLPRDTIDMLRSLRHWLLPGEYGNPPLFDDEFGPNDDLHPEDRDLADE